MTETPNTYRVATTLAAALRELADDAIDGCSLEQVVLYGTYTDGRGGYAGSLRRQFPPADLEALLAERETQAAEVRRLERELADTLSERDQARRHHEIAQQQGDSVKLLAEQIRRYAQWPGITDTATYPEVVEALRVCVRALVRALGMGVPHDDPERRPKLAASCGHTRGITTGGLCAECTAVPEMPETQPARHFSPGYQGEIPDHLGPAETCPMPACVTAREQHEAVADIQDLTYRLHAEQDAKGGE